MPRRCDLRSGNALGIVLGLVVLGAALLSARSAHADEAPSGPPPEARKAFADGKAAYERGEYAEALTLFQRAALIAPAPSLYYNIGMAYERLRRYEDAAIAFEKYLQLIEPPTTDDERDFQTKLRARAAANRSRARSPGAEAVPAPLVEPPPADARYPRYAYPSPLPANVVVVPQLTHQQKLEKARRHRNNGIALTVIGSVLTLTGAGVITWAAITPFDWGPKTGFVILGTVFFIPGVTLMIPGAVALAKWQKELNAELKRPDDGAAAQRAALDLAAPPPILQQGVEAGRFVLATPAIRF